MTRLLQIDASPRGERSHTRRLSREFVEHLQTADPGTEVVYRDIGRQPLPHVTEDWIAAAFTPPDQRDDSMHKSLQLSDELVGELQAADVIVLGIPFYNFGMPSGFKAWIDQIVRVGRTFDFDPEDVESPYTPLVTGKRVIAIISRGDGGYGPGGRNEVHNHLDGHLRTVLGFIGLTDVTIVAAENDEFGGTRLADSLEAARAELRQLAEEYTQVGCA